MPSKSAALLSETAHKKGVITSTFTTAARDVAQHDGNLRVVLTCGEVLSTLTMRLDVSTT